MLMNFVYFQVLWFGNILLGNVFVPVSIVILLLHLKQSLNYENDLIIMSVCGLGGFLLDSALIHFGVMEFNHGQISSFFIPPWLIMIWLGFAMTLNHSMHYFQQKPLWAFIGGGIAGPLSYLAGARLGAIEVPLGYMTTFIVFACIWAPLFYLLTRWAKSLNLKDDWSELKRQPLRNDDHDSANLV